MMITFTGKGGTTFTIDSTNMMMINEPNTQKDIQFRVDMTVGLAHHTVSITKDQYLKIHQQIRGDNGVTKSLIDHYKCNREDCDQGTC